LRPQTGELEPVFDDPDYHDIQAKLLQPRPEPDGRSSVVNEEDPNGELYCLSSFTSDLGQMDWIGSKNVPRLRVLEGIARSVPDGGGISPLAPKRILGDFPVEKDGSFYIKVPANTPIELQLLDEHGMALRTCGWIWAKNHEPRGCIGCHEDPERTPENRLVDAVKRPPIELTLPPEKRRTVDFRRDVMPILSAKCALTACHAGGVYPPDLGGDATKDRAYRSLLSGTDLREDASPVAEYVDPGQARTSPLVWSLLGKDTSRPWDTSHEEVEIQTMPPPGSEPLTENEIRTFVEWIDLGALWDAHPTGGVR
jgi:hypothetical protein